jgi:hypothetical protein
MSYGIHYAVGCALDLIGFTDSYWDGDITDRKSMSRYTLSLGQAQFTGQVRRNQPFVYLPQRPSTME